MQATDNQQNEVKIYHKLKVLMENYAHTQISQNKIHIIKWKHFT